MRLYVRLVPTLTTSLGEGVFPVELAVDVNPANTSAQVKATRTYRITSLPSRRSDTSRIIRRRPMGEVSWLLERLMGSRSQQKDRKEKRHGDLDSGPQSDPQARRWDAASRDLLTDVIGPRIGHPSTPPP